MVRNQVQDAQSYRTTVHNDQAPGVDGQSTRLEEDGQVALRQGRARAQPGSRRGSQVPAHVAPWLCSEGPRQHRHGCVVPRHGATQLDLRKCRTATHQVIVSKLVLIGHESCERPRSRRSGDHGSRREQGPGPDWTRIQRENRVPATLWSGGQACVNPTVGVTTVRTQL